MKKYLDPASGRLVYLSETASPEYWDTLWAGAADAKTVSGTRSARKLLRLFEKFVPQGRVLEAGCGHGGYALTLAKAGWDVLAVDYAPKTVERLRLDYPNLDIRLGDVRNLAIEDSTLSGYYSGGVIEHFWEGYEEIITEAERVLVQGGVAIFTFPAVSRLRQLRIWMRQYPLLSDTGLASEPSHFYQFALVVRDVRNDLERVGFRVTYTKWTAPVRGLIEEFSWLRRIYENLPAYVQRLMSVIGGACFWGHSVIIVAEKRKG